MLPSLPPIAMREDPKALATLLPIPHVQPSPSPSSPKKPALPSVAPAVAPSCTPGSGVATHLPGLHPGLLMALSCPGRASHNTQVRPLPTALPGFWPSRPCHPGVPQLGLAISTRPPGALRAPRLSSLQAPADARSRAASVYSGPQCSPPRARRRECCLWW